MLYTLTHAHSNILKMESLPVVIISCDNPKIQIIILTMKKRITDMSFALHFKFNNFVLFYY